MKNIVYILLIALLYFPEVNSQIVYHNADEFPLYGKATVHTESRYERLPDSLKDTLRKPLWNLGKNTAGLAVRFRSNSTTIAAKWNVLFNNVMDHMTFVNTKGLDLYSLKDGVWRFVNVARPFGHENSAVIIANMEPIDREYLLYLPLYDGITSLSIGVDSISYLSQPLVDYPVREKPLVFYGTSILQGGCASRPGMAHTNIISRRLNREIINLGFSGNAFLDLEIAHIMAEVDAGAFILDFVPNASVQQMDEKGVDFYRIIREKHPSTPILFIEDPVFTHTIFDRKVAKEVEAKNKALHALFDKLKGRGENNIHLVPSANIIGHDGEATIDGIHFTDLGFVRYADMLCPIIQNLIKYSDSK